ncbi:transposase [bacterium]|nr:transposase [bacterium]
MLLDFPGPGKPTNKKCIDSFDRILRDECLLVKFFLDIEDARQKIKDRWKEFNKLLTDYS